MKSPRQGCQAKYCGRRDCPRWNKWFRETWSAIQRKAKRKGENERE